MTSDLHLAAAKICASAGLGEYILRWNDGSGSLIRTWGDVLVALDFGDPPARRLAMEALPFEAAGRGDELDLALQRCLSPIIETSFASGADLIVERWLRDVAGQHPAAVGAPAPFSDVPAWIAWALDRFDPPAVVGPWGEAIMSSEELKLLCEFHARKAVGTAREQGWLEGPARNAVRVLNQVDRARPAPRPADVRRDRDA